jgi:DNA-binding FrmR family transcriptional regulator
MTKKISKKTTTSLKATSKKTVMLSSSCHEPPILETGFPSHAKEKKRLMRIKGQIDGIDRMVDEGRYCLDIIYQIRAAASALKAVEKEIMVTHIRSCVKKAIESDDPFESQDKIQEMMDFF